MSEGDPTIEGQQGENRAGRIIDLRKTLRKEESALLIEIRAAREEWRKWAITQVGNNRGIFEGVFTGAGSDGKPFKKRVLVHLEYRYLGFCPSDLNLREMLVVNETEKDTNGETTEAAMELEKFSVGRVVPGSSSRITDARFVDWSRAGGESIAFDAITVGYPNEAPNFAVLARRESNWLSNAVGKLTYTGRKF